MLESKVSFKAVLSCKEPQKSKKSPVTQHQDEEEGLWEKMDLNSNHEMMVSKGSPAQGLSFHIRKMGSAALPHSPITQVLRIKIEPSADTQ